MSIRFDRAQGKKATYIDNRPSMYQRQTKHKKKNEIDGTIELIRNAILRKEMMKNTYEFICINLKTSYLHSNTVIWLNHGILGERNMNETIVENAGESYTSSFFL